jgi:hypothetical protein
MGQRWLGIELQRRCILRELSLDPIDRGFKSAHLLFYFRPSAINKLRIKFFPQFDTQILINERS